MACPDRNLDDMYQEEGFCSSIDYVVLAGGQLVLMLLLEAALVAHVVLTRWRPWPRLLGSLFATGGALMAPVITLRFFWHEPLLVHGPILSAAFCVGTLVWTHSGDRIMHAELSRSLHATQTLLPTSFRKCSVQLLPPMSLIFAPLLASLHVFLVVGLARSSDQKSVISWFFGGYISFTFVFRSIPLAILYWERLRVEQQIPEGTPISLRGEIGSKRQDVKNSMIAGLYPLAALSIIFLVPNWQRYGGLVYFHMFLPFTFLFTAGQAACALPFFFESMKEDERRIEFECMVQQLDVARTVETGVRSIETAPICRTAPPAWERGVSCALLERFIATYNIPSHFSTTQVVEEVIKPLTRTAKCSLWEAVFMSGVVEAEALLGSATTFVSYAWKNNFVDLVAILRKQDDRCLRTFFFLDAFCMNQHKIADCTADSHRALLEDLKKAVSFPGRMVMVLEPWYQPKPLSRCWCLYEVYLASVTNTRVDMLFGDSSEMRIKRYLPRNLNLAGSITELTDVKNAQASLEEDREMIFGEIQGRIGVDHFVEHIKSKISESLYLATLYPLFLPVVPPVGEAPRPAAETESIEIALLKLEAELTS